MKSLKRLQKLRCKIQKSEKVRFSGYFGVHVAILYFTKLHLSPQPNLLDNEIISG